MSQPLRILIALLLGLAGGVAAAHGAPAFDLRLLTVADPIGKAWLAGLQMPLVPLVFGLLVTGIASARETTESGALAGRALVLFAVLLLASAGIAAVLATAILTQFPAFHGLATVLGPATAPVEVQAGGEWLLGFIPANPIAAAAGGQMAPLVLFALLFGFAATRIEPPARTRLIEFVQALVDTLLVLVRWVLALAPVGVAALGFAAGSRAGLGAAGALLHYVATVVAVCAAITLLLYPLATIAGRMSLARFARAALPAQAIALSTQSSVATLPAMIAAADGPLTVPEGARSIVLPMAISLFRVTSAAANLTVAVYVAAVHGVALSPLTLMIGAVVAAAVSLAAVGLPSQVSYFATIGPVCLAMGVPVDLLPLLLAIETVPDIFRTIGNVTADLAVTRILGRTAQ